jgi:branched-chain amino acid transport system permease protein
MEFWIQQTYNGLSYAALLFLLASGLTLILGVMHVINVAQGTFYMLAGYVGYSVIKLTGNFYLAFIIACIAVAVLGIGMERLFLRKLAGVNIRMMLATMGVALFMRDLSFLIWGGNPITLPVPEWLSKGLQVGNLYFSNMRFFMILMALVIFGLLWLFVNKTRIGAMVRAAVDNDETLGGFGVNVMLVRMGVFALGASVAAMGGVIGCAFMSIYPGLDFELLPYALVIIVVGGIGSLPGALIGALWVGLIDNFGKALIPELADFMIFAPMIIMLAIRPRGIFGKEI